MKRAGFAVLSGIALVVWACEPASITEAEQQLGRAGARSVLYTLPVLAETLTVDSILNDLTDESFDVLPGNLLGYTMDPETFTAAVGDKLQFNGLSFDQYQFTFGQMLRTSESGTNTSVAYAPSAGAGPQGAPQAANEIRLTTPNGSSVRLATVDTGTVYGSITNGTDCDADITVNLNDSTGTTVLTFPSATVLAGQTVEDSVRSDGVSVAGFVALQPQVTPLAACLPTPGTSVSADVTFRPLTLASVTLDNVNETFSDTYPALDSETRFQAVDTVVVSTGSFTVTAQNRLPVALHLDLSIAGTERPGDGLPISGSLDVPAAPGDGSTTSNQLVLDFSGATVMPGDMVVSVDGVGTAGSATVDSSVTTDAVVVDGSGDLDVAQASGALDPAATPELTVDVDEYSTIDPATLDFGDLTDVVREATLNTVQLELVVDNGADAPITLSNFQIGAVLLDPGTGQPQRDAGTGEYVYQEEGGAPILVDTTFTVARSSTTTITLANQATVDLINRIVNLILDDTTVAVVGVGSAVVGDGTQATITQTDDISVVVTPRFGIDLTIAASGVTFDNTTVQDGLKIDSAQRDNLAERLDTASVILNVENGTPFAVQAVVAVVADSVEGDIASMPGSVVLDTISIGAPAVDADGFVVAPATSTVTVSLTGDQARVFFDSLFTAGVTVILKPPTGGRGAIRGTDEVRVDASAQVKVRTGGNR